MSSVEKVAKDQASRHAKEFYDEHEWDDIFEKYAEVTNKLSKALKRLSEQEECGVDYGEEDVADMYYYERYREFLAIRIANEKLFEKEYEKDKNNDWILKKKRRFWG